MQQYINNRFGVKKLNKIHKHVTQPLNMIKTSLTFD